MGVLSQKGKMLYGHHTSLRLSSSMGTGLLSSFDTGTRRGMKTCKGLPLWAK